MQPEMVGLERMGGKVEQAVPANVLAASLFTRLRSRQNYTQADKILSGVRFGFGG
jgi:6-phosphogluconate dehydrogenase